MSFVVDVPVRVHSEANRRDHFRAVAARKKQQRSLVSAELWHHALLHPVPRAPYVVQLIRRCPPRSKCRDSDNLRSALKAVRDAVAEHLDIDDNDLRPNSQARWEYAQEESPRHSVLIRITSQEAT